ncbi:MAG: MATE family efflux transporter [Candidatus Marinimicrobia bacterium]|nr:MATE family efflux transporter [Candidatus Neomarinimicrobiota bacterium]
MFRNKALTREALAIGYPIIIGMLSTTIMNIADLAMVGRLGAAAIAAVGLCGIFFYTVSSAVSSLSVGVQTVASRRFGEQKFSETGRVLWNALLLAVVFGLPLLLLGAFFGDDFIGLLNNDPDVISLGEGYIRIRFLSIVFVAMNMAFLGFYNGVARTKIHLKVTVVANVLNVIMNYVFIFGHLGFPEMGVNGAALASTLSMLYATLNYAFLGYRDPLRDEYAFLKPSRLSGELMGKVIRLSAPVAVQNAVVHAGFTVFFVIVGHISTIALAASEIVFNILSFSFMPGFGMGMAAGTMVGKYLGDLQPDRAEESGWLNMRLTILFMGVMGIIFILIPEVILRGFTPEAEVIREGKIALQVLGAIQFVDACGLSLSGALRGAGDTTFVSAIEIVINLGMFLPMTWYFSIHLEMGLAGAWFGFALYIFVFAGAMIFRFHQGRWKTIQV